MSTNQSAEPPASTVLFARGVIARLSVWITLRIAIQQHWGGPGGPAKRTWLASEIVDAFETSPPPDDQYIEELLLQVMADEFEAVLEDGSAENVARDIVRMWEQTKEGNAEMVTKFEVINEKTKGKNVVVQEKIDSDGEDWESDGGEGSDDMEEDVPQLMEAQEPKPESGPTVDEEGFTLVQGKGKGRR